MSRATRPPHAAARGDGDAGVHRRGHARGEDRGRVARGADARDARARRRDGDGKGELSYHYWHGRNAGEAPAATAKVRSGGATTRARRRRRRRRRRRTTTDEERLLNDAANHERGSGGVDETSVVDADIGVERGGDVGRARAHGLGARAWRRSSSSEESLTWTARSRASSRAWSG